MCMYMCEHIHMCTCVCICIWGYVCLGICMCMYTCIHMYCVHEHVHAYIHCMGMLCLEVYGGICVCMYERGYVHTHSSSCSGKRNVQQEKGTCTMTGLKNDLRVHRKSCFLVRRGGRSFSLFRCFPG